MSWGRALSSVAAVAAVGATALLAVGMSRATTAADGVGSDAAATPFALPTLTRAPWSAPAPVSPAAASSSAVTSAAAAATSSPATSAARPAVPGSVAPRPAATTRATATAVAPSPRPATVPTTVRTAVRSTTSPRTTSAAPAPKPAVRGQALPLRFGTGSATRVITVVAASTGSTTATLQAWDRAPGGGWLKHGSAVTAHLGSDGLSSSPSEYRSATPIGSFTLTQAFGYYGNPGTGLPYFRTTGADWWISQAGPLYNTHQHCWSNCGFRLGDPNEHLSAITPQYNYAVVIDYNTRNSPTGVRAGAGSAFFLHVSDGGPTAGCVSIPQSTLVSLMRWLTPSAAPRILIGTR